jgi:hypothetical protein
MATPFPFTAGNVLTAAQMNSIGESVSFTPTLSNLTIGNGTRTGTYVLINKTVYFQVKVTFGSTTTLTGNCDLTLPLAPTGVSTFDAINATCNFVKNSPTAIYLGFTIIVGATIRLLCIQTNGALAVQADIGATVPFTWGANDVISVAGNYQIA